MKYDKIKKYRLSHQAIAKAFNYKNVAAFRCSSAHSRIMTGINNILNIVDNG